MDLFLMLNHDVINSTIQVDILKAETITKILLILKLVGVAMLLPSFSLYQYGNTDKAEA